VTDPLAALRKHAAKQEALSAERDALIVQARADGASVVSIANTIGLTRQQVHRILAAANNS
jgi:hypothetical protein